jgi:hypothetical protein
LVGVATREPVTVELPIPELVRETYLEIRQTQTHTVVAVLELLSPATGWLTKMRRTPSPTSDRFILSLGKPLAKEGNHGEHASSV